MVKKTQLPFKHQSFLHAKNREPIFFASKRGQAVPLLILAIGILLVIYAYLLPLSEKCKLIPGLPECKTEQNVKLLEATPGLLEEQENAARYILPGAELFRMTEVDVSSVLEGKKASKSWFFSSAAEGTFEAQEHGRSAKLFVFVNKGSGGLKVYVNGERVGTVYGEGVHTLFVEIKDLKEENTIKVIPTTPLMPFFSNDYEIGKIILKEEYVITNNRVSVPFEIIEAPKNILDITLSLRTRCPTNENLTIFLGNDKIISDKICQGLTKDVTNVLLKNNLSGNLTFTSEGNYVISDVKFDIRMKERTWPTYYFYFTGSEKPVLLKMYLNQTGMKELTAYVNGNALSVETSKKEWQTAINKYLIDNSTNSILLIPKQTITVSSLVVE
jgi:hypothetical protein